MKASKFEATQSAYYLFELLLFFVSIATVFVFMPLVFYYFEKYRVENSSISGVKLKFNGRVEEAYFIFVVYLGVYAAFAMISNYVLYFFGLLLSSKLTFWVVNGAVLLINAFFLRTQLRNWAHRKTSLENCLGPTFKKPMLWETVKWETAAWAINLRAVKLASPHAHEIRMKLFAKKYVLGGSNLGFVGTKGQIYKKWWAFVALNLITLGFFTPVINYNIYKWRVEGLHLAA